MIKVNHLSKKYGDHYAVKDLSFEIEEGKVYGFLGPNGAGKSTTMNIMTGYIAPSEGDVVINGFDVVKDAEEAKKNVGYLPEIPPLYQDMTVKEYLDFAAELKMVKKADRKAQVEDVMEKTFVKDMEKRLIKNLSKGYKQRVGLAQAMLGNPKVIILDEPTVGLDPKQIIEIRDLIRNLKQEHTVILSSHILTEISEVCDEILIIAKGVMIATGSVDEIMKKLSPGNKLDINCKGSAQDVEKVLKGIKGIENVVISGSSEEGILDISLNYDGAEETKDLVYKSLAEKQIQIYMFKNHSESLEDAFLELTSDNNVEKILEELKEQENSGDTVEPSAETTDEESNESEMETTDINEKIEENIEENKEENKEEE